MQSKGIIDKDKLTVERIKKLKQEVLGRIKVLEEYLESEKLELELINKALGYYKEA